MIRFSLIVATINRKKELDEFLESIKKSDYPLSKIEVIIVDQNDQIDLSFIIKKFEKFFKIYHIKSEKKGLSYNRNIGLKIASGQIVCFPDDDCKYLKDTLKNVDIKFLKDKSLNLVMGRIVDEFGNDCLKKWSKNIEKVTQKKFYFKVSSITIFKRNDEKKMFDQDFGVGNYFGSCEDAEYIYSIIKENKKVKYYPDVVLYHPSSQGSFDYKKSYSYALGHGAFCKKHLDYNLVKLFILGLGNTILKLFKNIIFYNKENCKVCFFSIRGRIEGIIKYKK